MFPLPERLFLTFHIFSDILIPITLENFPQLLFIPDTLPFLIHQALEIILSWKYHLSFLKFISLEALESHSIYKYIWFRIRKEIKANDKNYKDSGSFSSKICLVNLPEILT